jgi:sarcosine oxidase subunit beta
VETVWAGLIDVTPDALPVLDADTGVDGLAVAMGFSGHGFCLGPLTGKIVADFVAGRTPGVPLEPFRLARFDRWNAPSEPATLHG